MLKGEATTDIGVHRIITTSHKVEIFERSVRNILHEGDFYVRKNQNEETGSHT